MVHYNDIQEGQTVKYFGHICNVVEKVKTDSTYHLHLNQPNSLMMDINHMVESNDGNFKNISL